MSAKRRSAVTRGLPVGLHLHPTKGWRYYHPQQKRYHYFGARVSRADAIQAALTLNEVLRARVSLVDAVLGAEGNETVSSCIATHLADYLPQSCGPKALDNRRYILQAVSRSSLGARPIAAITTRDCVLYLRTLETPNMRHAYRAALHGLWSTALSEGLVETNVVSAIKTPTPQRQRSRLTLEDFFQIRSCAPSWLARAMDFALQTLQRREDLCLARWDDLTETHLRFRQGKTGTCIAIELSPPLLGVLEAFRDGVPSPFIIHRLPGKLKSQEDRSADRQHHTQVLPGQLSRAFAKARQASGIAIGQANPPTFHEIRSLGIALYRSQPGWSLDLARSLAGHADQRMTARYADGHAPAYTPVPSGLVLPR